MGLAKHILSVLRLFMNYSLLFILTNLLRSGHKKEEKAHSLYIYKYIYIYTYSITCPEWTGVNAVESRHPQSLRFFDVLSWMIKWMMNGLVNSFRRPEKEDEDYEDMKMMKIYNCQRFFDAMDLGLVPNVQSPWAA